jgi:hypothetical protein
MMLMLTTQVPQSQNEQAVSHHASTARTLITAIRLTFSQHFGVHIAVPLHPHSPNPLGIVSKILSQDKNPRTGGVAQVAECLPNKHEAQLKPQYSIKKKKRRILVRYGGS